MNIISILPARMNSSRFPGKPLKKIMGMPMIGHCYKRSAMCKDISETYVATCDIAIKDYVDSIGGKTIMTSNLFKHMLCTYRVCTHTHIYIYIYRYI